MAGTNTEKPMGKTEKKKVAPVKEAKESKAVAPVKNEEKKIEEKKESKQPVKVEKVKKNEVKVSVQNVSASTKVSRDICKFIKKKKIERAISDLEEVIKLRRAVPMKGEIPHRKGNIMSGRFPKNAAKEFLVLVKSLQANAVQHDLENPVIVEAVANKGTTTYARGGRARKKRTHILLTAKEKKLVKKEKKKE